VRQVFTRWRRSVGLSVVDAPDAPKEDERIESEKRPSLSRQLDRAIDKLSRVAGRLDLPAAFQDEVTRAITQLSTIRESARTARGEARKTLTAELPAVDVTLVGAGRQVLAGDMLERLRDDATQDLATYRARLAPDVWSRSVERALDQLVRDHLGLPTLVFE
jgi:hypothetical protein